MTSSPEQLTSRQFEDALQQLSDRIKPKQWEMLCAHYHAPNRSVTARQLAKEVGFKSYDAVNLQYGLLGSLLGSVLGFEKSKSSVLATFTKPKDKDNSEWLWVMLPALAKALEKIGRVGSSENRQGRDLSTEDLDCMADKLPWIIPNVFIMPPHQYVVENKLQTEEEREAFESLRDACAHHPKRWKAFFRAYKAKNSYMEIGEHRYWYSQIGAARMMNRSFRESEVGNIRGGPSDRAVKNWSGCTYAWTREYGVECENLRRYCNLMVVEANPSGIGFSIVRYAAMVTRNAVRSWDAGRKDHPVDKSIEENLRGLLHGVAAVDGIKPANSKQVSCSDDEMKLNAVWMSQKEMDVSRVATDLRWFSTAPMLEIERVFSLGPDRRKLVQLNVPPV